MDTHVCCVVLDKAEHSWFDALDLILSSACARQIPGAVKLFIESYHTLQETCREVQGNQIETCIRNEGAPGCQSHICKHRNMPV